MSQNPPEVKTALADEAPANLVTTADAAVDPKLSVTLPPPDSAITMDAATILHYAKDCKVTSAASSLKIQEARARANTRMKAWTEMRLAMTRPLDALKKYYIGLWPTDALAEAITIFDAKILAYDAAQEEIRKEAQRKVDAAAAADRKRLQDIAFAAALKANEEATAKRKAAADAEAAGNAAEAAKLASQAEKIEQKADAKVEQFQARAAAVVAPVIQSEGAKASGSSFRDAYDIEVIDPTKINAPFMTPDMVKIGKQVRALGLDAAALIGPGVKITKRKALATKKVTEEA